MHLSKHLLSQCLNNWAIYRKLHNNSCITALKTPIVVLCTNIIHSMQNRYSATPHRGTIAQINHRDTWPEHATQEMFTYSLTPSTCTL